MERDIEKKVSVIQICHGPLIPSYISAYSLRCYSLFENYRTTKMSVGGTIMRDKSVDDTFQFRSIIMTVISVIKGNRSFEILLSRGSHLRKKYLKALRKRVSESKVIVMEGPWQYHLIKEQLDQKILIYDAHNCETQLRKNNVYEGETSILEGELVRASDLVIAVTPGDLKNLMKFDEQHPDKFLLVPHILPPVSVEWNGIKSREITFIGSMYSPNISALKFILSLAHQMPEFHFNVIGNVRTGFFSKKTSNVKFYGIVSEKRKTEILSTSMFGINPVTEGSGRNVKMVDYLRHSVPIISTKVGVRGFEKYDVEKTIVIAEIEDFERKILYYDGHRDEIAVLSQLSGELYKEIYTQEKTNVPLERLHSSKR